MKCLVTGGAGFIGSHLCECLLADGHDVICVDDLSAGRIDNVEHLSKSPNFHKRFYDILDEENLAPHFRGVDWVFHLAAKADIVPSIKNPVSYYKTNVTGTLAVLEYSRYAGVKRFIYAASSSCYGPASIPLMSECSEMAPAYPYALTKMMGEELVLHWAKVYKLPAMSLRLFNVYGPRHRSTKNYGAVFGVFLSQLANGKPVTIVGDGTQTRDFTFVDDVCEAFLLAAESKVSGAQLNIGSGATHEINKIADLLGATGKVFIPKRPGEPDCTFADISMAKQMIGYEPRVSIEEGCQIMRREMHHFKGAPLWNPDTIKEATKDWFKYLGDA